MRLETEKQLGGQLYEVKQTSKEDSAMAEKAAAAPTGKEGEVTKVYEIVEEDDEFEEFEEVYHSLPPSCDIPSLELTGA